MDTIRREELAMREVTARLVKILADDHPREEIAQTVQAVHHRFDGKPIRDFVPVLVERIARQELRAHG